MIIKIRGNVLIHPSVIHKLLSSPPLEHPFLSIKKTWKLSITHRLIKFEKQLFRTVVENMPTSKNKDFEKWNLLVY
jgi:hypothetical protein